MHEFIIDKCELISESVTVIEQYFQNIHTPADFKEHKDGVLYLDAIMMRLQVIGENIKKISKLQADFFSSVLEYDISHVIRFRDFISHHYEKPDSDIIFEICHDDIPLLKTKITNFLNEQSQK